jgi:DNA-binding protein H-NS
MARKSLRPYLNQIRTWTRQGRTDAWVAHQLEVTVQEVQEFKRQNGLVDGEQEGNASWSDEEVDLRAADEALIAAELEAAEKEAGLKADQNGEPSDAATAEEAGGSSEQEGRRQGTKPAKRESGPLRLEGTFDHGEEGYGLWLDPAIKDHPIYAEHWAGHRPVEVVVEADRIVITRLGEDS